MCYWYSYFSPHRARFHWQATAVSAELKISHFSWKMLNFSDFSWSARQLCVEQWRAEVCFWCACESWAAHLESHPPWWEWPRAGAAAAEARSSRARLGGGEQGQRVLVPAHIPSQGFRIFRITQSSFKIRGEVFALSRMSFPSEPDSRWQWKWV